jgi:hypothetical protein
MQVVSGPAIAVAPGLTRLAEMLSAPGFSQLPAQLSQFTDVMTEMSKRLGPLTQFAESAGGLFGGLRFPGMTSSPRPAPATPGGHDVVIHERVVTPIVQSTPSPSVKKAAPRKAAPKQAVPKQAAPRKATPKKAAPRKAAGRGAPAKR